MNKYMFLFFPVAFFVTTANASDFNFSMKEFVKEKTEAEKKAENKAWQERRETKHYETELLKMKRKDWDNQAMIKALEFMNEINIAKKARDYAEVARLKERELLFGYAWTLVADHEAAIVHKWKESNEEFQQAATPLARANILKNHWWENRKIDWDYWMQKCIDIAGEYYGYAKVTDLSSKKPYKTYPYKTYSCILPSLNTPDKLQKIQKRRLKK